jgi:hypothetical protein
VLCQLLLEQNRVLLQQYQVHGVYHSQPLGSTSWAIQGGQVHPLHQVQWQLWWHRSWAQGPQQQDIVYLSKHSKRQ